MGLSILIGGPHRDLRPESRLARNETLIHVARNSSNAPANAVIVDPLCKTIANRLDPYGAIGPRLLGSGYCSIYL
jgi:hypothetical protein